MKEIVVVEESSSSDGGGIHGEESSTKRSFWDSWESILTEERVMGRQGEESSIKAPLHHLGSSIRSSPNSTTTTLLQMNGPVGEEEDGRRKYSKHESNRRFSAGRPESPARSRRGSSIRFAGIPTSPISFLYTTLVFLIPFLSSSTLALLSPDELASLENGAFQVWRLTPSTNDQLEYLQGLYNASADLNLDFWKGPRALGALVDVMVPPSKQDELSDEFGQRLLKHETIIQDVQELTEERLKKSQIRQLFHRKLRDDGFSRVLYDFQRYHSSQEMFDYMKEVSRQYSNIARIEQLGRTYEDRPLYVLKIGNNDQSYNKKGIWIDGGIHAREWAAPHVAIYFIHQLVTKYGRDPKITHYVDNINWYIAPNLNPDGYEHSRSATFPEVRLWRKNRSPNRCRKADSKKCCRGVDLNRNFDFHWLGAGSSSNPCSEVYAGDRPFSEPESMAVRDFIYRYSNQLDGFITLHTYSQIWVHSFGHERKEYPPDVKELHHLGRKAAKALKKLYGTKYKVGSGADTLYPAAGGSDDWAKDKVGIKFVYLLELRPGEYEWDGFILDEIQLLPTAKETWIGVQVVADEILRRSGRTFNPVGEDEGRNESKKDADGNENDSMGSEIGGCEDKRYACRRWVKNNADLCQTVRYFMNEQCKKSCHAVFRNFC